MITPLPDMPAGTIGFEAHGAISAEDYRSVLEPAYDAASAAGQKLRVLAVLGPDFEGFDAGSMVEDARAGFAHWSSWERIAIVTDRDAVATTIRWLGWLVPGDVRVFPLAELAAATDWLAEAAS